MQKSLFALSILAILLTFSVVSQGQQEEEAAVPEGIIVQPAENDFTIEVGTDRQSYSPRERLKISLNLSTDAYVYVYDINPQGKVTLLFPNGFQRNNFLKAGTHQLPSTEEYSLIVSGPLGIERVQVLALLQPMPILELTAQSDLDIHVFPQLSTEPVEFKPQVQQMIEINAEPDEWAADWTEFVIRNPSANLAITTNPQGANVFINEQFMGQSPLQIDVPTGRVKIRLAREGFADWSSDLNLSNRESRELTVALQPANSTTTPGQPAIGNTTPSGSISGISTDFFQSFMLGFDVGANSDGTYSAGVELGFSSGLGIGGSMTFNEDNVPQYYNIGRPIQFPREQIFNLGPETEAFLKLTVPVTDTLRLSLGGGIAIQERVHIASGQSTYVIDAADILIVPNGYRDTISYWTVMGGFGLRLSEHGILNIGHHNRRGWTAGLTVAF